MNQGEVVSTQTGKDSKNTDLKLSVDPVTPTKEAPKPVKETFALLKEKELLKKGNLPEKQIKNLTNAFRSVVDNGLKPEEYEKIWKKSFYRGSK